MVTGYSLDIKFSLTCFHRLVYLGLVHKWFLAYIMVKNNFNVRRDRRSTTSKRNSNFYPNNDSTCFFVFAELHLTLNQPVCPTSVPYQWICTWTSKAPVPNSNKVISDHWIDISMSEPDVLKFGPGSAEAVDAYLNYRRFVSGFLHFD